MHDTVLSGRVVTASADMATGGFVGIRDGKISYVGSADPGESVHRHDYGDALIFPGAIDAQVHSRSQKNREGLTFATKAAAAGGVTTIVEMPYDEGLLVCNADAVGQKAADVRRQAHVDVALYGTILPTDGTSKIAEQVAAGVCAFKFSTFGTDAVRFPRIAPELMRAAFAEIARFGLAAGVHNEIDEIVRGNIAALKAAGRTDYRVHNETHSPLAELLATVEVYEIGALTGCPAHIVHSSLSRGVDICESYRRQGFKSSIEVCIHYLLFTEDETVRKKGGLAKINPPIRPSIEREGLWNRLAAGLIDLVSTDHVAWSLDRKSDPDMFKNSSGGPSLEVMVPALIAGCLDRGVNLTTAARVLAYNPARHFRLDSTKGAIEAGKDADLCVIDLKRAPWSVGNSQTVSDWSLYDGIELPQVRETWLRGRRVWDGRSVINNAGDGQYVTPQGVR